MCEAAAQDAERGVGLEGVWETGGGLAEGSATVHGTFQVEMTYITFNTCWRVVVLV
jgi:hypothetical protein